MPELWYRTLLYAATRIYYRRVRVVRLAEFEMGKGPVLFVGLHRNGAVDGMLYKSVFPRAVFVVARRLLRSRFSRLYFTGIPVTREHDDAAPGVQTRRDNAQSLTAAVDHLATGGQLFILPEGTSDLGPKHLPFKPGVARVIADLLQRGITPLVVPLGVFYESPPAFRSDVCIVMGTPIDTRLEQSLDRSTRIAELMDRITSSLEAIAVEAADTNALRQIETLAAIAIEDAGAQWWRVQKMLTNERQSLPAAERLLRLRGASVDRAGVPRFSKHGVLWNALWLALQGAIVGAAALANAVPLAGAWLAGRRVADAPNTIALWRIIVGAPLSVLWLLGVAAAGMLVGGWFPAAYLAITLLGLWVYPELCVRWPMLRNRVQNPTLGREITAIRQSLLAAAEDSRV